MELRNKYGQKMTPASNNNGFKIIDYEDRQEIWIDCDGKWKLFSTVKNKSKHKTK